MFKIGQKVRCVYDIGAKVYLKKGEIYTVDEVSKSLLCINGTNHSKLRFEPVEDTPTIDIKKSVSEISSKPAGEVLLINNFGHLSNRSEPVEDTPTIDINKYHYALGYRDAVAEILAETKDKIKLPEIAKAYAENFEKHWAHDWHVS